MPVQTNVDVCEHLEEKLWKLKASMVSSKKKKKRSEVTISLFYRKASLSDLGDPVHKYFDTVFHTMLEDQSTNTGFYNNVVQWRQVLLELGNFQKPKNIHQ